MLGPCVLRYPESPLRSARVQENVTPHTSHPWFWGSWLWALAGSGALPQASAKQVSPESCRVETQVLLSASRFSVVHLSSHLPSLQAKGVSSQKECLWTDLVMTCGLKTASFSSLTHTHTHTHTHIPPHPTTRKTSVCGQVYVCIRLELLHIS